MAERGNGIGESPLETASPVLSMAQEKIGWNWEVALLAFEGGPWST